MNAVSWRLIAVCLCAIVVGVLIGCHGDDGVGGVFDAAAYEGDWDGQWNNTTFSTTGAASFTFTADPGAGTIDVVVDVDGNALGGSDPGPITFSGTYDDSGFTGNASVATFGDVSFQINPNGTISGTATNVPSSAIDSVTFTGTTSGQRITINYTVNFAGGGSATGNVVVDKQTP